MTAATLPAVRNALTDNYLPLVKYQPVSDKRGWFKVVKPGLHLETSGPNWVSVMYHGAEHPLDGAKILQQAVIVLQARGYQVSQVQSWMPVGTVTAAGEFSKPTGKVLKHWGISAEDVHRRDQDWMVYAPCRLEVSKPEKERDKDGHR